MSVVAIDSDDDPYQPYSPRFDGPSPRRQRLGGGRGGAGMPVREEVDGGGDRDVMDRYHEG